MIGRIGYVTSPLVRRENAESLGWVFWYLAQEGKLQAVVSDSNIDALVDRLKDGIEAEDSQVALALGQLGPRASRAVPALEVLHARACEDLPIFRTGRWPIDDFELALEAITGHAPACH